MHKGWIVNHAASQFVVCMTIRDRLKPKVYMHYAAIKYAFGSSGNFFLPTWNTFLDKGIGEEKRYVALYMSLIFETSFRRLPSLRLGYYLLNLIFFCIISESLGKKDVIGSVFLAGQSSQRYMLMFKSRGYKEFIFSTPKHKQIVGFKLEFSTIIIKSDWLIVLSYSICRLDLIQDYILPFRLKIY